MRKKYVAAAILACFLSLGMGIVIGMGMDENNLFGTAADSSIQVRNDHYFVDGQEVDFGALITTLQLDQTNAFDDQIGDQMKLIKKRNESLQKANEILAKMRQAKSELKEMDDEIYDFCRDNGFTVVGTIGEKLTKEQWDANIEMLMGYIDGLDSESQLNMIRLQSLMDKRNQRYEQITNTLQKDQKTRDSIVGNTR